MKKKVLIMLLAFAMTFSLAACGGTKNAVTTGVENDKDEEKENKEDKDTEETKVEEDKDIKENKDNEEITDSEETNSDAESGDKKPSSDVVLGGDFTKDYDGFQYLYCETLMTMSEENETTGKMESESIQVFIPKADYSSVNRDTAYAEDLGVDFRITLNPYMRYEQEDYLAEENLAYYIEYQYDPFYNTDYKDIEFSEVEILEKGVRATVKYCYYDSWTEKYMPVFCTYYMTELSKDLTVLVEVEVNLEDVTGKTKFLLEELEKFYEFDIEWDKEEAQHKVDSYISSSEADVNMVTTGFMMFELPAGWKQDYDYNDYSSYAFAPKGDVEKAGCVIDISREYLGSESFDMADMMADEEEIVSYAEYLEESLGEDARDITVEYIGETNIGNALKFSYIIEEGEEEVLNVVYVITNGYYVYSFEGLAVSGCDEDITVILDNAIATAVIKSN